MNSQRYARICEMLARRQPDLTVCMEQVHKPHNVSAVIRTADAVGVHEVHAVWPSSRMRTMASAAAGSNSWVQVKTHRTIADAVGHLKGQGMQILATHLSGKAIDFREIDYTRPTCILMGQEKTGITQEALALADQDIIIPMIGMVQSLNVSVAHALVHRPSAIISARMVANNFFMSQTPFVLDFRRTHRFKIVKTQMQRYLCG